MGRAKTALTRTAGRALARLIRHVHRTSDVVLEPADLAERIGALHPLIFACWHGQFMMFAAMRDCVPEMAAMVARHGDGELIGEAMRAFDVELIRGAGAGERKKDRGGAAALRASVRTLNENKTLFMTADVPPGPARKAGMGIVTIAQLSGRPILPVAAATSRFKSFDTWSRMTVNLPYSKLAFVVGEPITVPRDANEQALEAARIQIEEALNAATVRAYEIVGADVRGATPLGQLAASAPPPPGGALGAYRKGASALKVAAPALLAYRSRKGKEEPARRNERLGKPPLARPQGRLIWVHAASVGETNVALPVIEQLLKRDPALNVLLTTGTTTSAALAARRLPARAFHQYVPLDAPDYVAAFLDHWRPKLAIFTESEIWPNLILSAHERTIPLVLINARMSPRSMRRWRRFARFGRPLFSRFALVLTQNERIARVIRFLGAPKVMTTGNLKIDNPPPPVDETALAALKAATTGRALFLAASTHPGEDEIVARAHALLREKQPSLLTIIVPRHPERGGDIMARLVKMGLRIERRSEVPVPTAAADVYIADSIGELGTFYKLCPVAFIGGSLAERGGQNPIEAVRHGTAVITGPYTHNFHDAYTALKKAGGALEVASAEDLAAAAGGLIGDDKRRDEVVKNAEQALARMSGALQRTLDALEPFLKQDARTPSRAS